jgi:hypothetical protein
MEGTDIYQIAKNCRTNVEMIEKFYTAPLKHTLDAPPSMSASLAETGDDQQARSFWTDEGPARRAPPSAPFSDAQPTHRRDVSIKIHWEWRA